MSPSRTEPTVVYTDGACSGNPGPGGWAWVVPDGPFAAGPAEHTTNQRMEIAAALEALRALAGPVQVVSDSTYVVNCFRDGWWEGWLRKGWINSKKEPVANRDLWEPLIDLYRDRVDTDGPVSFRWVKGHSGDPWNDIADRLAVEAAETQRARQGDEPPTWLGPADERGSTAPTTRPKGGPESLLPEGRLLAVFGHRPPELGGYDDNDVADGVRRRLREIIDAKVQIDADLVVLSGLRLGAEMLGGEAVLESGVPLVAVLPYPDPEKVWPRRSQERFRAIVDRCTAVITLERKVPESKAKAGAALQRRDAWLVRQADEAILVWDEHDPSLARLHRSLEDRLGDDVWILRPAE